MTQVELDFRYWNNGHKTPLPDWAKYYLDLGATVSLKRDANRRLVTAMAVPTRSHAAILVATGVIISRVKSDTSSRRHTPEEQFEMLSGLPGGTSVILHKGDNTVRGILVGTKVDPSDGIARIGIQRTRGRQTTRGNGEGPLTEWLPPTASLQVEVSSEDWTRLPSNVAGRADAATSRSEFVSRVFQGLDLWNLVTQSSLDCVVLGGVGLLVQEATATKLSVGSRGTAATAGALGDILRVRRLSSENEAFRSDFFPVNSNEHVWRTERLPPGVVIFDGASGFIKWRHKWQQSDWVIILDRTETHFIDAVQLVNDIYLSRTGKSGEILENRPLPVESVSFTVDR